MVIVSPLLPLLPLLAGLAARGALAHTSHVDVPANLTTRALARDAYGYSIEPVWLSAYAGTGLARALLSAVAGVTGKAPPVRIGGTTSDETTLLAGGAAEVPGGGVSSDGTGPRFNVTAGWYASWAGYFPEGTDLTYALNFAANESGWADAGRQAAAAWGALGDKLVMFELGNEVDHYVNEHWRAQGWGVDEYVAQFENLTGGIRAAEWYAAAGEAAPKFQAASFADPPWIPDQQDEIDDFDIINLTRAGLVDPEHKVIETYSVHLYPQSTCDTERWLRMRLDVLSNHTVLWLNVSQYVPQVAAADGANTPLVLGETNSVSCSGRSGISDTFGAALWSVDYVLLAASVGMPKVYFHLGAQSQYSAFTPAAYVLNNETLAPGIRANFYSHYFFAKIVEGLGEGEGEAFGVAALPGANASDLSGYAVYRGGGRGGLAKLVFLDMGVWNGTQGLGNPSTLAGTDGTVFSNGTRPAYNMSVATPWAAGAEVEVVRLQGPGTNAKSLVNVSGVTFDSATGRKVGEEAAEVLRVGGRGEVRFGMVQAEGVLLTLVASVGGGGANGSSSPGPEVTTSGAAAWTSGRQSIAVPLAVGLGWVASLLGFVLF